jgi:hypothetical protein
MDIETPLPPEVFITDPDNLPFVEDEASFADTQQKNLRSARTWFLVTIAALVAYLVLRSAARDLVGFVFLFALLAFLLMCRGLYRAWMARQLARGQFIEATVLRGNIIHYHGMGRQSGGGQYLNITYEFDSPSGKHIRKMESVRRNDMRLRVPPAGTQVKIRYINDRFFRMM